MAYRKVKLSIIAKDYLPAYAARRRPPRGDGKALSLKGEAKQMIALIFVTAYIG